MKAHACMSESGLVLTTIAGGCLSPEYASGDTIRQCFVGSFPSWVSGYGCKVNFRRPQHLASLALYPKAQNPQP